MRLGQAITDALGRIRILAEERRVSIALEENVSSDTQIIADPHKLALVLNCLLSNAVKYSQEGGAVTVSTTIVTGVPYIEVRVTDSGIGIPENEQIKIGEKFFRATNAVQLNGDGNGLGLFISRNIIEAHSGKLTFQSKPGKGSTFSFTLPTDPGLVPAPAKLKT